MLSVVEVKCPHCGTLGQILVPPLGSVIYGPCPMCKEMVALFGNEVLPLDSKRMKDASPRVRRQHLLETLIQCLKRKVKQLIPDEEEPEAEPLPRRQRARPTIQNPQMGTITNREYKDFLRIDLALIDKPEYFSKFFG